MNRRQLGRTDLMVVPWCLGCNVMGNTLDEARSVAVLDAYVAAGGNFIDTANIYGAGESEAIIGRWMKARGNRDELVVATKVGWTAAPPVFEEGLSRHMIRNSLEASLRRLGTDHIDLYYAHCDDPLVPIEESLRAFDELRSHGKVRWLGASNYDAHRLEAALATSDVVGLARYECVQERYNLVERAEFERELQPLCVENGLAATTYFSLARGFLTGKYSGADGIPESPRAKVVVDNYFNDDAFAVLYRVRATAASAGATPAQVALAWLLEQPAVVSCISAATSTEQVAELAGAPRVRLTDEALRFLRGGTSSGAGTGQSR